MENESRKYHIPYDAALFDVDSENQTFGCRQNNPDICGSNGMQSVCAFVREDHICKKPSRAWKKQFEKLQGLQE